MHLLLSASLLLSQTTPLASAPGQLPVSELWRGLRSAADRLEQQSEMRAQWTRFAAEEGLSEAAWSEYVRVRLAFETTRAGGLWGLKWDITNREPDSKAIWAQWRVAPAPTLSGVMTTTATAECDELSALFSLVASKLGVKNVGLFWPTSNHTVAVWTAPSESGGTRVVVPTSQIFLDDDQSLGTDVFDPHTQKTIYTYRGNADISDDALLSADRIAWMIAQAPKVAQEPMELQRQRNAREAEQ